MIHHRKSAETAMNESHYSVSQLPVRAKPPSTEAGPKQSALECMKMQSGCNLVATSLLENLADLIQALTLVMPFGCTATANRG